MSEQEISRDTAFRICNKNLYLTYPQCDVTATVAMENLMKLWPSTIKYAIIVTELHEDGTPHLHLLIQMKTRADIKSASFLDSITGKHGNYQVP